MSHLPIYFSFSNIYCYGPLLHMVQLSYIQSDDKTFVDQPLKYSPSQVLQNFSAFKTSHPNPRQSEIRQFVDDNFYPSGKLTLSASILCQYKPLYSL